MTSPLLWKLRWLSCELQFEHNPYCTILLLILCRAMITRPRPKKPHKIRQSMRPMRPVHVSEQLLLCRSLLYCTASTLLSDATSTNATVTITGEGGGGASVGGGGARREGGFGVGCRLVGEAAAVKAPLPGMAGLLDGWGLDASSRWLGFGCVKFLPPKSKV